MSNDRHTIPLALAFLVIGVLGTLLFLRSNNSYAPTVTVPQMFQTAGQIQEQLDSVPIPSPQPIYTVGVVGPQPQNMQTHEAGVTLAAQTAIVQRQQYNLQQMLQVETISAVLPATATPGPALIPYSACQNTRIYKAPNDADEYYIGFVPQDTVVYIIAQSSDGKYAQLLSPGTEQWWTPKANICQ